MNNDQYELRAMVYMRDTREMRQHVRIGTWDDHRAFQDYLERDPNNRIVEVKMKRLTPGSSKIANRRVGQ